MVIIVLDPGTYSSVPFDVSSRILEVVPGPTVLRQEVAAIAQQGTIGVTVVNTWDTLAIRGRIFLDLSRFNWGV
jgi:hypothetical protein